MNFNRIFKEGLSGLEPSFDSKALADSIIERTQSMNAKKQHKAGRRAVMIPAAAIAAAAAVTIGAGAVNDWDYGRLFESVFRGRYDSADAYAGSDPVPVFDFDKIGKAIDSVYEIDGAKITVEGVIADDYNAAVIIRADFDPDKAFTGNNNGYDPAAWSLFASMYLGDKADDSGEFGSEFGSLDLADRLRDHLLRKKFADGSTQISPIGSTGNSITFIVEHHAQEKPISGETLIFTLREFYRYADKDLTERETLPIDVEFSVDIDFDTSATKKASGVACGDTVITEAVLTPMGFRAICDGVLPNKILSYDYYNPTGYGSAVLTKTDGTTLSVAGERGVSTKNSRTGVYTYSFEFLYPVDMSDVSAITFDDLTIELG